MVYGVSNRYRFIEELGEVPRLRYLTHGGGQAKSPTSFFNRVAATLWIPACPVPLFGIPNCGPGRLLLFSGSINQLEEPL